jgi:hypothetical protein
MEEEKGQTVIFKTLHKKLKIELELYLKPCAIKGDAEGQVVPGLLMVPVVLLLLQ